MIFAQTLRVCREGKPISTFPDHALIDEFSTELATDPPCQPALARVACRQCDGEYSGNFGIFCDHLQAALRQVGDRAVSRQRTAPELNLRGSSAFLTFASTSIHQHVDPLSRSIMAHQPSQPVYRRTVGITLAEPVAIYLFSLVCFYRVASGMAVFEPTTGRSQKSTAEAGIKPEDIVRWCCRMPMPTTSTVSSTPAKGLIIVRSRW
jgi:hypothetical protein